MSTAVLFMVPVLALPCLVLALHPSFHNDPGFPTPSESASESGQVTALAVQLPTKKSEQRSASPPTPSPPTDPEAEVVNLKSVSHFPSRRSRVLELPVRLGSVEDYERDPVLNPSARPLSLSERTQLEEVLRSGGDEYKQAWEKAMMERHDWATLKASEFGEGLPPESAEARALGEHQWESGPNEYSLVSVALIGSPGYQVVKLVPGEFAPMDIAYDNAWSVLEETERQIQALFRAHQ